MSVLPVQVGILESTPRVGRYLYFSLTPSSNPKEALTRLGSVVDGDKVVLGIGASVLKQLGCEIEAMRDFPVHSASGLDIPSTPAALWCWLRGDDRGDLLHLGRQVRKELAPDFEVTKTIDGFQYGESLDLTGYEDGTENPEGEDAVAAAVLEDEKKGLNGSSFVAVQQWVHDLDAFQAMPQLQRDHAIGRRASDNEELDDAPESAHVKRTAQESFDPEAFVLRRSMPWCEAQTEGLVFVAFGKSFDAFEAQLNNMLGYNDGIVDALFDFTRPLTGSYFWCPPMDEKTVDLSFLGID